MTLSPRRLLAICLSAALVGCATPMEDMIDVPEKDMTDVYHDAIGAGSASRVLDDRSVLRRPLTEGEMDVTPYVRTESNALQSKFQLLPNPTLYMFVNVHLATADEVPIPAYLTEFKMYQKNHYALPGEALLTSP